MINGANAIYTNAGRHIPPGSHWNIEMSIFGQKNRPFFLLRDNLDLKWRCWKAAEGPTQLIYQLNETKAGCTELRRGPSHSCGGEGDTPAPVFRAGGESEGCAAAEVMHSPFTLAQVTGRRALLTVRHTTEEWSFLGDNTAQPEGWIRRTGTSGHQGYQSHIQGNKLQNILISIYGPAFEVHILVNVLQFSSRHKINFIIC